MKTTIFEKRKALAVDEDGDIDVEIFQNENGKFGVRLVSIYSNDTCLNSCWFYNTLEKAHEKFKTMRGL